MTKVNNKEQSILNDEDWEILLPGTEIKLGRTTITIRPLTIAEFSFVTSKAIYVVNQVKKIKNPGQSFNTPAGFKRIVGIIIKEAPELITMLTGIPVIDIARLPVTKNLELVSEAWRLNIQDQETLAKNLQSVGDMIHQLTGLTLDPAQTPQNLET